MLRWGTGIRERVFYEHDGDGKRIAAYIRCCGGGPGGHPGGTVPQLDRSFLWDPQFSLPMMVSSNTKQINRPDVKVDQTYGNGLISTTEGAEVLYQHPDGIGSIAGLTDQTGTPVSRTTYSPFGEVTGTEVLNPSVSGTSAFGFAGEYEDAISGLSHMRARQYDPSIGRFISPDPLGGEMATSTYGYGGNRPSVMVDPSGMASESSCTWSCAGKWYSRNWRRGLGTHCGTDGSVGASDILCEIPGFAADGLSPDKACSIEGYKTYSGTLWGPVGASTTINGCGGVSYGAGGSSGGGFSETDNPTGKPSCVSAEVVMAGPTDYQGTTGMTLGGGIGGTGSSGFYSGTSWGYEISAGGNINPSECLGNLARGAGSVADG